MVFGVIDFLQKMNERIQLYYYDTSGWLVLFIKNFWYFGKDSIKIKPRLNSSKFLVCKSICNLILPVKSEVISPKKNVFCTNSTSTDSTEVLTQNIEKLSLDLIFIDNVCQNIKSFSKQNSAKNFLKTGQKLTRTNSVALW